MLSGGADIRVIQELLGHASINTTMRYTQVSISRLQEVHQKFHPRGKWMRPANDKAHGFKPVGFLLAPEFSPGISNRAWRWS